MSDDEFWRATLRDIMALHAAYEQAEERLDRRAALMCAVFAGGKVEDYMPSGGGSRSLPSAEDLAAKLDMFAGVFCKTEGVATGGSGS